MNNVCKQAIRFFGAEKQIDQAIEELAELIVSLNHLRRRRETIGEVLSEIADVEIMLEQLKIIFSAHEDVNKRKMIKIVKLQEMLDEQERNGSQGKIYTRQ